MTAFGSSATPRQITGITAAMAAMATAGNVGYDAGVLGTFVVPSLTAELGHANNISIPVIIIPEQASDIQISYTARSELARSIVESRLAGLRGLKSLDMVPQYPTQSYMSDFFDE